MTHDGNFAISRQSTYILNIHLATRCNGPRVARVIFRSIEGSLLIGSPILHNLSFCIFIPEILQGLISLYVILWRSVINSKHITKTRSPPRHLATFTQTHRIFNDIMSFVRFNRSTLFGLNRQVNPKNLVSWLKPFLGGLVCEAENGHPVFFLRYLIKLNHVPQVGATKITPKKDKKKRWKKPTTKIHLSHLVSVRSLVATWLPQPRHVWHLTLRRWGSIHPPSQAFQGTPCCALRQGVAGSNSNSTRVFWLR